ncbi:hypothetical protein BZA77DRAFT_310637 [Pyronema omphalodes]|nr:hypothetical protein BZA77DRAFT_310637 [Pyronema omphalodes]
MPPHIYIPLTLFILYPTYHLLSFFSPFLFKSQGWRGVVFFLYLFFHNYNSLSAMLDLILPIILDLIMILQ